MSAILVTGSAGFIGFHVAKSLLEAGNTVIGADNFNTYYDPALKRARTEILEQSPKFISLEIDLAEREKVSKSFREFSPEVICHLAAQPGVRYSLINPFAYQKSNLEAFINIIEESRLLPVQRFVYASSSSVYGGNTKMPYSEEDPVNTPVSLYAATKRANELLAYTYSHLWGLQTIGLRFFTVYGAWGRPDMAYWSFLEAIIHGEPIKIFNYGKNRRDFTYIDDIVEGVVRALFSNNLERYELINLGNNKPVAVLDFVKILEDLAGKQALTEMAPAQPGDVVATYAQIDKAQKKLGFSPKTSLAEGLRHFVNWYTQETSLVESVRRYRFSEQKTNL